MKINKKNAFKLWEKHYGDARFAEDFHGYLMCRDGYGKRDVTIIETDDGREYDGDKDFLKADEIDQITSYVHEVKRMFRDDLLEGKSVFLEWSYAYNCDIKKRRTGNRYLVFYEVRTV